MLSPEDCTSLIEAFTEQQILNHVRSLDTGMHLSQERIQVGGAMNFTDFLIFFSCVFFVFVYSGFVGIGGGSHNFVGIF